MAGIVESAPNGANHSTTTLTHNSCCSTFCFRNFSKALGEICSSKISTDGGLMPKGIVLFCLILGCCLFATLAADPLQQANPAQSQEASSAAKMPTPADGYNVHVLAPHLVDGKVMGPYHHYCKVIAPDPQIVCLIYESTQPNAMLAQVEYIMAKKLTRSKVSRESWNKYWHDHTVEIASGRVQVLDLPPDKAKEVADLVATTDGLIVHFYYDDNLPNGRTSVGQAVGHKPMKEAEFKNHGAK